MNARPFIFGILVGVLVCACAGVQYPYNTLGPDESGDLKGVLLGKTPKDDRPLSDCAPTTQNKSPCIVVKIEVWERVLTDNQTLSDQLQACKQGQ